jgi:hypothetical protein
MTVYFLVVGNFELCIQFVGFEQNKLYGGGETRGKYKE